MKIAIIGRGRAGGGLAARLADTRHPVRLYGGRDTTEVREKTILLTVPDPVIGAVAGRLTLRPSQVILHCSGSLGPEVLPAGARGVMHPLASFADPARPPSLEGVTFLIAGDAPATERARAIARALGGRPLVAPLHGPAYHAAAALSANGAAALAAVAVRALCALGLGPKDARRAVGALLCTVGQNVERVGVPGALSGPILRGDAATVRRHRDALEALDPAARAAYDAIAPAILDQARRAGLPAEHAATIEAALARPPAPGSPERGSP